MIVEPLVPAYRSLLARYLAAENDLARESTLMAADTLARQLLPHRVSMDDMLALHGRAQQRLAKDLEQAAPGSDGHAQLRALARGDAMPLLLAVLLAVLLPQQVEEQHRAERRWQAEHARLAAAFEQTEDLVLMFDAGGRLEYLNPAFMRATGWTLKTAAARPSELWQLELPATGTLHVELQQRRSDGSRFPASWSISSIVDGQAQVLGHVCIGRDIGQQRQVDEALRQNDRLRAVATLAAGVAHDFNNVLGSIQGLTELCQALSEPEGPLARPLGGIQKASQRAAGLVSQLLSFAREHPPKRLPLDLATWLGEQLDLLAASLPGGVQLRARSLPGLKVCADEAQLEQVLLNLVKNAGHAMRQTGGEVRVEADAWTDQEGREWARLRVIDQGEGIPPEVLPRIFDPFFTTKPVDEGTGLGLSVAYGIVRQHDGLLRAESPPGGPTVFTLLMPRDGNEGDGSPSRVEGLSPAPPAP